MALIDSLELHPNPETDAQKRQNWARVKARDGTLGGALALHEERLDSIDGGDAASDGGPITAIFDTTTAAGAPVYVSSSGHVDQADADSLALANVVGLALESVTAGGTGSYVANGFLTLADWTAIIGAASLTAGAIYYLSDVAGDLTTTAPTTVGKVVVWVGLAVTTTTMRIEIHQGVLL